ncbi:MAG TPA: queuosine precursor transporter [Acidimicrobiales bacterium]|nr:queuosine precursor transporter [Acidimicrobiales bacterium]
MDRRQESPAEEVPAPATAGPAPRRAGRRGVGARGSARSGGDVLDRSLVPAAGPTATPVGVAAVGAYVGAQVVANVASVKIGSVLGRAVDMGTFVYPVTFTLRDVVHKALGRRLARTVVVTAAGVNLFLAAYLQWAVRVRPDASYASGDEFRAVLGPVWRIVVASVVAQVASELVDTEVYHWFVTRVTTRHQWARVAVSNAVSVPLDNAVFAVGAFGALPFLAGNAATLPWPAVWDVFVVNLAVKAAVSAASLPLIYLSPDRDWRRDPGDT